MVIQQPGDVDTKRREHATGSKKDASIAGSFLRLVLNKDQDEITSEANDGAPAHDESSLSKFVANKGSGNAAKEGQEVRGCRKTLRRNGRVPHVANDGGKKIGETRKRVVAAEMDNSVDIVLIVSQASENLVPANLSLLRSISDLETLNGICGILFGQVFGLGGRVCQEEPGDYGEEDSRSTLCNVQVSYAVCSEVIANIPMMKRYLQGSKEPLMWVIP